jgi:hypothetical protein
MLLVSPATGLVAAGRVWVFPAQVMPGEDLSKRRRAAIGSWAAMVGALILSQSIDDPALSDDLLSETRAWIAERTPRTSHRPSSSPPQP